MAELSITVRLRPTRIGFLVRPTDLSAVRQIMRYCTCIWGGTYNPIIPVFRTPPKEWREEHPRAKGGAVGRGYVEYFEPDVFVESEKGLLEELGLDALRHDRGIFHTTIGLDQFLAPGRNRDNAEPAFGLTAVDVFRELYEKEQRFQPRRDRLALSVRPQRGNALSEAIFGVFPTQKHSRYISEWYSNVFSPEQADASSETWLKVYKKGGETPLTVSRYGLDRKRYWYHDLIVQIFDPRQATDLIDLWNARLDPWPVVPVPIEWTTELESELKTLAKVEYRAVKDNPSGLMHHLTVQFGRSIERQQSDEIFRQLKRDLPDDCLRSSFGARPVWIPPTNSFMHWDERLEITAEDQRTSITVKEGQGLSAQFETLAPKFASRYGGNECRWINAVTATNYGSPSIATVLPFNTFNRNWPHLGLGGEEVLIGREGWIFAQRFKSMSQHMSLLTMEEAIAGSLKSRGIEAKLSDPGHVAKQMLDQLGGLWGAHLLADLETLQLLNKMAGAVRRRKLGADVVEESFEGRSALVEQWAALVARRKGKDRSRLELSDFTARNVIRLGLQTACPNCQANNWHGLTEVDYKIDCERCLKQYEFPQAALSDGNRNWHYRVVGPFSIPDYGRGSYSVLLTLRLLKSIGHSMSDMTFSTAMDLKYDGIDAESDFVVLRGTERDETARPPVFIFGEAKSLGQGELVKSKDLAKLRSIGQKMPGAFLVVSVLRDRFTTREKKLLQKFIKWARRPDTFGRPTNPVILLTGNELFFRFMLSSTWKDLGPPFEKFSDFQHTRDMYTLAEATQILHGGMPPYHETYREIRKGRSRAKKVPSPNVPGAIEPAAFIGSGQSRSTDH